MAWSPADLVTIGFFPKRPARRVDWPRAPQVEWVCSVGDCSCLTQSPDGWIDHWVHNDLWVFDSLAAVERVLSPGESGAFVRYGLRSLPIAFDGERELPLDLSRIRPEPIPAGFASLGYDLCSRSVGTNLECSPLSCNDLAGECGANRWCLLDDFDDAPRTVRNLRRMGAEPGPYLLIEVWADRRPDQVQTRTGAATDAVRG